MTLYHVTDIKRIGTILKNGLLPMLGNDSAMCNEERAAIFLCEEKDVPYWEILLGKRGVLRVESKSQLKSFSCGFYREYYMYDRIPPEYLSIARFSEPKVLHMKQLCINYLFTISHLCVKIIILYHYNQNCDDFQLLLQELDQELSTMLVILSRLDYSKLSFDEIKKALLTYSDDGEYTFLDTYQNTSVRLYEQIDNFATDLTKINRHNLYLFIKETFSGCLDINTGGWTGDWGCIKPSEPSAPVPIKMVL